jgi:hypothetical protein
LAPLKTGVMMVICILAANLRIVWQINFDFTFPKLRMLISFLKQMEKPNHYVCNPIPYDEKYQLYLFFWQESLGPC